MEQLTLVERNDLQYHIQRIKSGLDGAIEAGKSLAIIKDQKLYREHGTFEAFCRAEFNISRTRAFQLRRVYELTQDENVHNCEHLSNEGQARELAKVEPEKRAEVVEKVMGRDGKITARAIKEEANSAMEEPPYLEQQCEKLPKYIPCEGMRIWSTVKSFLDGITKQDKEREQALMECISYCEQRIKTKQ